MLNHYSGVYVVINALDERPDKDGTHSQLLAKLRDLQCKTNLRLMVSSRFIPDIVVEFRLMPMLEVRASDADVEQFVGAQTYRLPKCVQRDDELQGFVQDKIVEAVEGMSVFRVHVVTASSRLYQVPSRPSRFLTREPRPKSSWC